MMSWWQIVLTVWAVFTVLIALFFFRVCRNSMRRGNVPRAADPGEDDDL